MARKRWIKLWTQEILYGTTSKELVPGERWVWVGFMALAGDSIIPGVICAAPDVPWTDEQLCSILRVSKDILLSAKQKMVSYHKISVNNDGIIHIINWESYQSEYERTKQYKKHQYPMKENSTPETTSKATSDAVVDNSVDSSTPKSTAVPDQIRTDQKIYLNGINTIKGFTALLEQLKNAKDKVGCLVDDFKFLHSSAPPEDFEKLGGRIAGVLKAANNDYGYVLRLMWDSSSMSIAGSHLSYIQGIIKGEKHAEDEKAHKGKLPKHYDSPEEFDRKYREQYYAEHPEFKPPAES